MYSTEHLRKIYIFIVPLFMRIIYGSVLEEKYNGYDLSYTNEKMFGIAIS